MEILHKCVFILIYQYKFDVHEKSFLPELCYLLCSVPKALVEILNLMLGFLFQPNIMLEYAFLMLQLLQERSFVSHLNIMLVINPFTSGIIWHVIFMDQGICFITINFCRKKNEFFIVFINRSK